MSRGSGPPSLPPECVTRQRAAAGRRPPDAVARLLLLLDLRLELLDLCLLGLKHRCLRCSWLLPCCCD